MHNGDVMPVFVQIYLPNHGETEVNTLRTGHLIV